MDFALSEDQRLFQDSLDRALDRACPLARVRAFAEGDKPVARDVWRALTGFGVPGVLIAPEHGGLGLTLLDAALIAEALGAHVAPTPFLGSAVLAPLALRWAGSTAQQAAWLPKLAAGEALAGIAVGEASGVTRREGRLHGAASFAMDAAEADVLIIADRGAGLWLVPGDASGVERTVLATIDRSRPMSELRFDGAPAEPLASGDGPAALARLRGAAWTMLAADMLGASGRMLEMAVAYAKERRQFGRPIGSFQAVKHLCAEMASELEPCRALVWYAAHAAHALPDEAPVAAAHAKAHLSEVSRFVARSAIEVHGGVGFTDALGLHYWFKRVGLSRQLLGGPERVRRLAAAMQGLTPYPATPS